MFCSSIGHEPISMKLYGGLPERRLFFAVVWNIVPYLCWFGTSLSNSAPRKGAQHSRQRRSHCVCALAVHSSFAHSLCSVGTWDVTELFDVVTELFSSSEEDDNILIHRD